LAREDTKQAILTPAELVKYLDDLTQAVAEPAELDEKLQQAVENHLKNGDLVLGLSGGGGPDSLDEWLRQKFS
jgi:6-phosphogluconolactonase/glucosamine-6-phosphate isomerase/deaminase